MPRPGSSRGATGSKKAGRPPESTRDPPGCVAGRRRPRPPSARIRCCSSRPKILGRAGRRQSRSSGNASATSRRRPIRERPGPQLRQLVAQVPGLCQANPVRGRRTYGAWRAVSSSGIGDQATLAFEAEGGRATREREPVPDQDAAVRRVLAWLAERCIRARRSVRDRRGRPPRGPRRRALHGAGPDRRRGAGGDRAARGPGAAAQRAEPCRHPAQPGPRSAPTSPMVAVFDTAFHADDARARLPLRHPPRAGREAFDPALRLPRPRLPLGARRATPSMHGIPRERATLVAFHLGNGCSAAAIKRGRSVDTSMGLTPLEGLVDGNPVGRR